MTLDLPGFADPVAGAQACFRAVLDAMARPGTRREAGADLTPPAPLDPATAAVLLTLVDAEAPLWLAPQLSDAWDWLAFHCGARRTPDRARAAFVCAQHMPRLASLASGSDAAPEEAATLVLQVAALGRGRTLLLSGPGLRVHCRLAVEGLPDDFVAQWAASRAGFPRGVDLVLCAGTGLAALPRGVRVEED